MNRFEFYTNLQKFRNKDSSDSLKHYGIIGQKWGTRRWQNPDGTFNEEGKIRYFGKIGSKAGNKSENKSTKFAIDKDNLTKYTLDELNEIENKTAEHASTLREKNDKRDMELASKLADKPFYNRWSNEKAYDDYMYAKMKAAEEILKENPDLEFYPNHWLDQWQGDEDESFEIHNKDLSDLEKKIEETYGGAPFDSEERKKCWRLRTIHTNILHEESEKINSEIIDRTEEILKENNYKIDEKEKIEFVTKQKDYPNWELEEYDNENGEKHYGIHKKFELPNGATVNVKIDKNGSLSATDGNMRDLDWMFSDFDRIDQGFKRTNIYGSIADYLYNNRWNLFKRDGEGFRSSYTNYNKAKKYIMDMSKDEFKDAINEKILPKLNIKSGDIISDHGSFCTAKYGIDGIDGDIDVTLYSGGGNIKDLNNLKLDDLLD